MSVYYTLIEWHGSYTFLVSLAKNDRADLHHSLITHLLDKFPSIDFYEDVETMMTLYRFRDPADEAFYILWANEYDGACDERKLEI